MLWCAIGAQFSLHVDPSLGICHFCLGSQIRFATNTRLRDWPYFQNYSWRNSKKNYGNIRTKKIWPCMLILFFCAEMFLFFFLFDANLNGPHKKLFQSLAYNNGLCKQLNKTKTIKKKIEKTKHAQNAAPIIKNDVFLFLAARHCCFVLYACANSFGFVFHTNRISQRPRTWTCCPYFLIPSCGGNPCMCNWGTHRRCTSGVQSDLVCEQIKRK